MSVERTDHPLIGKSCHRLRDLEAFAGRCGWQTSFRQLEPGQSGLDAMLSLASDATVIDIAISNRLEIMGRIRSDLVAVVIPAGPATIFLNGHHVAAGDAVALPSNKSVLLWCGRDARLTVVLLPSAPRYSGLFFDQHARQLLSNRQILRAECDSSALANLRVKATSEQVRPSGPGTFVYRAECVAAIRQMSWLDGWDESRDEQRYRIIRTSIDYIDTHLAEPFSVNELSRAAATSLSKLERTFRKMLNMSPSQYILARRLTAVRRSLANVDAPSPSVASAALDNGFSHLGRFAGAYKNQFGELPRETLQLGQTAV